MSEIVEFEHKVHLGDLRPHPDGAIFGFARFPSHLVALDRFTDDAYTNRLDSQFYRAPFMGRCDYGFFSDDREQMERLIAGEALQQAAIAGRTVCIVTSSDAFDEQVQSSGGQVITLGSEPWPYNILDTSYNVDENGLFADHDGVRRYKCSYLWGFLVEQSGASLDDWDARHQLYERFTILFNQVYAKGTGKRSMPNMQDDLLPLLTADEQLGPLFAAQLADGGFYSCRSSTPQLRGRLTVLKLPREATTSQLAFLLEWLRCELHAVLRFEGRDKKTILYFDEIERFACSLGLLHDLREIHALGAKLGSVSWTVCSGKPSLLVADRGEHGYTPNDQLLSMPLIRLYGHLERAEAEMMRRYDRLLDYEIERITKMPTDQVFLTGGYQPEQIDLAFSVEEALADQQRRERERKQALRSFKPVVPKP